MKKKNVIGHMTAPKEGKVHFLKRIQLLPLLLCLLAAIIIWLFVVNLSDRRVPELFSPETEQTAEGTAE
ncbi:MAG TPA: hypothetical protein DDW30_09840 [Clostridiales bacterium]|nr:hypothetical protein [Clostridiales bacterium]